MPKIAKSAPTWLKATTPTPSPTPKNKSQLLNIIKKPKPTDIKSIIKEANKRSISNNTKVNESLVLNPKLTSTIENKIQQPLAKMQDVNKTTDSEKNQQLTELIVNDETKKEKIVPLEASEYIIEPVIDQNSKNIPDTNKKEQKTNGKEVKIAINKISKEKNEKILTQIESALSKSVKFNKNLLYGPKENVPSEPEVPLMIPIFRSSLKQNKTEEFTNDDKKHQILKAVSKDMVQNEAARPKFNQSIIYQLFENLNLRPGAGVVPLHRTENDETRTNEAKPISEPDVQKQNINYQNVNEDKSLLTQEIGKNFPTGTNVEPKFLNMNSLIQTPSLNFQSQKPDDAMVTNENDADTNNFTSENQFLHRYQKETDANLNLSQSNEHTITSQNNYTKSLIPVIFIPITQNPTLLPHQQEIIDNSASLQNTNEAKPMLVNLNSIADIINQNLQHQATDANPLSKRESDDDNTAFKANFVKPFDLNMFPINQMPRQIGNPKLTNAIPILNEQCGDKTGYISATEYVNPDAINLQFLYQLMSQNPQWADVKRLSTGNVDISRPVDKSENYSQLDLNLVTQMPNRNFFYQKTEALKPTFQNTVIPQEIGTNAASGTNNDAAKPVYVNPNSFTQIPSQNIQYPNSRDPKPMFRQEACRNSASLAKMNSAVPNTNSISLAPSPKFQYSSLADAKMSTNIGPNTSKSSNNANLIIYKPETVSLLNTYGEFLKELTMTVLVPLHVSSLQKKGK